MNFTNFGTRKVVWDSSDDHTDHFVCLIHKSIDLERRSQYWCIGNCIIWQSSIVLKNQLICHHSIKWDVNMVSQYQMNDFNTKVRNRIYLYIINEIRIGAQSLVHNFTKFQTSKPSLFGGCVKWIVNEWKYSKCWYSWWIRLVS